MLNLIAASVASSTLAVAGNRPPAPPPSFLPPQAAAPSSSTELAALKVCSCGHSKFWLPIGNQDIPENYRCCRCKPFPMEKLVQRQFDLISKTETDGPLSEPRFEPITFSAGVPACCRCAGSLITLSPLGYSCANCNRGIHPYLAVSYLWGVT